MNKASYPCVDVNFPGSVPLRFSIYLLCDNLILPDPVNSMLTTGKFICSIQLSIISCTFLITLLSISACWNSTYSGITRGPIYYSQTYVKRHIQQEIVLTGGCKGGGVAQWLGHRISDQGVPGSNPGRCAFRCGLEQVTFTLLSTGWTQEAVDGWPTWIDRDEAGG